MVDERIDALGEALEYFCDQALIKHHACCGHILYSFLGGAFGNVPNQDLVDNVLNSSEICLA